MRRGIDYIGVGIGAVIVNSDGKMLLAKRGKKARNERGKWEFPGGAVEFGDTMRDTIIREMKEELGIEIEPIHHLSPIDHIIPDEKQHWVTSMFISKIVKGEPQIMEPDKCSEIGWFTLEEIKKLPLSIATQEGVLKLKKINISDFV
jgi:mutator protein MutT